MIPDVPYRALREPNRAVFYIPFTEIDAKSSPKTIDFATFIIHTDASFFGVVALLLAGTGLYAVLHSSVLQRRREIGIRMALGSSRAGIVRLMTLDIYVVIALGSCAGLALGFGAARYGESLPYQVKATEAAMIALPTVAIVLTALIAMLPAVVRALRTDPTKILRAE